MLSSSGGWSTQRNRKPFKQGQRRALRGSMQPTGESRGGPGAVLRFCREQGAGAIYRHRA
jgi:hypothetical protein